VAQDEAFSFMYPHLLDRWRAAGVDLLPFSPLADQAPDAGADAVWLPGGYPELYSDHLGANVVMREEIKSAVDQGMPTYGECGGFMYLTEGMLEGADFVGIFPVRTKMLPKRKALGYREVRFLSDTLLGVAGKICRGHEFHYSEILGMPESVERCYEVNRSGLVVAEEGYRVNNCLGSYIHLHFGSNPELAVSFLKACSAYRQPAGEKQGS
jgi:cobyrinic acid a,c-diamide synthase